MARVDASNIRIYDPRPSVTELADAAKLTSRDRVKRQKFLPGSISYGEPLGKVYQYVSVDFILGCIGGSQWGRQE